MKPVLMLALVLSFSLTGVCPARADDSIPSMKSTDSASSDPGVLIVRPVTEVDGLHDIMLTDLVEARGVSTAVANALQNVRLSDAPKSSESRYFTSADLSQTLRVTLRQVMQASGELPRFRIPSRVVVARKSLKITTEAVQEAILEKFKVQCADCEFEFTLFTMPLLPRFIGADQTWSVRVRSDLPRGSFTIPLEIQARENDIADSSGDASAVSKAVNKAKLFWVSGQVSMRRKSAIASRSAAIGEHLRGEDFEMKMHDVTFSNDTPATASEIGNSVLARGISAGEVIWRSQLRREAAVKNGDPVRVMVGSGDWEVTVDGISQSQAYVGESVRVKIPSTQKMVSGILRERGVVELQ